MSSVPGVPAKELPPTRAQLFLVASIVGLTFIGWSSSKLVCNYHPFETHKPASVPVDQYARDPKHAAIEFHHRLAVCDFETALVLSTAELAGEVNRLRGEATPAHCDERRRFAPRVLSFGELLTKEATVATARVHSHFNDVKETKIVEMVSEQGTWKARAIRGE